MEDHETSTIWELRKKVTTLENQKMMLEKKLKFKNILNDMRSSTQINEEEILEMKRRILELERENRRLKQESGVNVKKFGMDEELKTVRKMLKNEKKMHEADLAVLSNLQSVGFCRLM
jgi:Fic family protein